MRRRERPVRLTPDGSFPFHRLRFQVSKTRPVYPQVADMGADMIDVPFCARHGSCGVAPVSPWTRLIRRPELAGYGRFLAVRSAIILLGRPCLCLAMPRLRRSEGVFLLRTGRTLERRPAWAWMAQRSRRFCPPFR